MKNKERKASLKWSAQGLLATPRVKYELDFHKMSVVSPILHSKLQAKTTPPQKKYKNKKKNNNNKSTHTHTIFEFWQ